MSKRYENEMAERVRGEVKGRGGRGWEKSEKLKGLLLVERKCLPARQRRSTVAFLL